MSAFGTTVAKVQLLVTGERVTEEIRGPHLSRGPQYSPLLPFKEKQVWWQGKLKTVVINSLHHLQSRSSAWAKMITLYHTDQQLSAGFRFKSIWKHWVRASLSKMNNYTESGHFQHWQSFVSACSRKTILETEKSPPNFPICKRLRVSGASTSPGIAFVTLKKSAEAQFLQKCWPSYSIYPLARDGDGQCGQKSCIDLLEPHFPLVKTPVIFPQVWKAEFVWMGWKGLFQSSSELCYFSQGNGCTAAHCICCSRIDLHYQPSTLTSQQHPKARYGPDPGSLGVLQLVLFYSSMLPQAGHYPYPHKRV